MCISILRSYCPKKVACSQYHILNLCSIKSGIYFAFIMTITWGHYARIREPGFYLSLFFTGHGSSGVLLALPAESPLFPVRSGATCCHGLLCSCLDHLGVAEAQTNLTTIKATISASPFSQYPTLTPICLSWRPLVKSAFASPPIYLWTQSLLI